MLILCDGLASGITKNCGKSENSIMQEYNLSVSTGGKTIDSAKQPVLQVSAAVTEVLRAGVGRSTTWRCVTLRSVTPWLTRGGRGSR